MSATLVIAGIKTQQRHQKSSFTIMNTYTFLFIIGLLLFTPTPDTQITHVEQGNVTEIPACPPYSEKAHERLKRFVSSSLPHPGDGVTIEAVSPSEIVWVEQHIRCEHMVHDPESEMFLTFWKSNQYYFILAMHRNPVRWLDENTLDVNLGTDRVHILDLNLNRIGVFLL
jgi:hypothetical protein